MELAGDNKMETSHHEKWTAHTAAISEETPAMIYIGL